VRKRKNLLRAVKPQKVWVVELLCSTRCAGRLMLGAVLTASSDHEGQVTYSPFDCEKSTSDGKGFQPWARLWWPT